jgi:hypothetical protein
VPLTYKRRFDDIKDMSIADGLKVILIEHSFTTIDKTFSIRSGFYFRN